jgi:O-antigen/teichoic acid export membrane protein
MTTVKREHRRVAGSKETCRDLLKHSSIYGLGQILSRLASFLLLPVYTSYLRPADYGAIAILDLTARILAILIGAGMAAAVTRYHFEAQDVAEHDQIWWTGLIFIMFLATVVVGPTWLFRHELAHLTLGPAIDQGRFYYTLVLATLWFGVIEQLADAYLRIRKWSRVSVSVNLGRLLLNIGLNVYFLAVLHLGIVGILFGNLITGGVTTVTLLAIFSRSLGPCAFHRPLVRQLLRFSSPLVVMTLLSALMHQVDRYVLRLFVDMDQIGVYSLAYTIGQAVNTLCLLPFNAIWGVVMYEVAQQPDAKYVYARVFQYYVYGLTLVSLGISLFARQLLAMMVAPDYLRAADLIPIICLAYIFFSLHEHFKVPVMLAKRTAVLPPVVGFAAAINIGANLLLIPLLGPAGAAWASVVTFATYSFVGLWRYRTIDRYEYPLLKCGAVVAGMITCYLGVRLGAHLGFWDVGIMIIATIVCIAWAVFLFGPLLRQFLSERSLQFLNQAKSTVVP